MGSTGGTPHRTREPTTGPGGEYFPAGDAWETIEPRAAGWSAERLDDLATLVEGRNSRSLMVLAGGRVMAEHYWAGADETSVQEVFSCQKSVTSALVGIAQARGLLSIGDSVSSYLGDGWSRAQPPDERKIALRHLLSMDSGLDPSTMEKAAEPATRWAYNSFAYQKLRLVLEKAAGQDIQTVTRAWLLDPIGAGASARWQPRPGQSTAAVDPMGARQWGLLMAARDMARFGLLVQRSGSWAGAEVVPRDWLAASLSASQEMNPGYGYLWWLFGVTAKAKAGARGTHVPADFVAALGALDQKIYVCPSLDVVLVRQGLAAGEASEAESNFDTELLRGLLLARL